MQQILVKCEGHEVSHNPPRNAPPPFNIPGLRHNGRFMHKDAVDGGATASPFVINITWDASVAAAPPAFKTTVTNAVTYLQTNFVTPATINITIGWGSINGTLLGGGMLGESMYYLNTVTYAQIINALKVKASTSTDTQVIASLPGTDPIGHQYWVTSAQAKALGLSTSTGTDGWVGFSSAVAWTFDNTAGVAPGTYDLMGTVLHEITEVLGRGRFSTVNSAPAFFILDLLAFTAPNARTTVRGGYFSVDNGSTPLANFNRVNSGDTGDWDSSTANDSFDAFSNGGVVNAFSTADLTVMDAIGYIPAGGISPPPPPPPLIVAPTGVLITPMIALMAAVQGNGVLNAATPLLTVSQVDGTGTSYSYVLGGPDASFFTIAGPTISTANQIPGGRLYMISVTAVDTVNNLSSPTIPFNIVIGTANNDAFSLISMSGRSNTRTLTFGLQGSDIIDGSQMIGSLWFVGGSSGDTLTGGNKNINTYIFVATSESTAAFPDTITNFNIRKDKISLGALGNLTYHGRAQSILPPMSVSWNIVNRNTVVYVNYSNIFDSPNSSAVMKIILRGSMQLTNSNFI
jgi:hypothetical protein